MQPMCALSAFVPASLSMQALNVMVGKIFPNHTTGLSLLCFKGRMKNLSSITCLIIYIFYTSTLNLFPNGCTTINAGGRRRKKRRWPHFSAVEKNCTLISEPSDRTLSRSLDCLMDS